MYRAYCKTIHIIFVISLLSAAFLAGQTRIGVLSIPPRPASAPGGMEFMQSISTMDFADREAAILNQLLAGNIPDFMRNLVQLNTTFSDAVENSHELTYYLHGRGQR